MRPLVAVTGVTGYVGGRLVPELLDAGYRVRAIARNPTRLRGRPWYDQVDVVAADAADPDQIAAALEAQLTGPRLRSASISSPVGEQHRRVSPRPAAATAPVARSTAARPHAPRR